ncbi:NUDIX domain-containing protein [Paenibacillus sp. 32O-W]|uniref:NUDIX domain-containing protein n=1 Tax=Paenibacillus sp. 32O-W TaxID=1695218 RepID=UPI0011A09CCB|nr:NUDIX domain-containing protein [Paenibacillus sp. 32O-W]
MNTRLMTTAFLFNDGRILMLKRAANRKIAPGLWTGVGGHLEPEEINNPEQACIREIYEETGIVKEELADLKLRYILIRLKGTEIREQFVYFGKTYKEEVMDTVEGDLHWVRRDVINTLEMPWSIQTMFEHYFEIGRETMKSYVGVMTVHSDGNPLMNWTELTDPVKV